MICRQCDSRIPERLLALERFACPNCGKVYVRRAEPGRDRAEVSRTPARQRAEMEPPAAVRGVELPGMKSKLAAAALAYFFGIFGAHQFYLGNRKQGIVRAAIFAVAFVLLWICQGIGMAVLPLVAQIAGGLIGPVGIALVLLNAATLLAFLAIAFGTGAKLVFTVIAAVLIVALMVWNYVDLLRILLNKLLPADGSEYAGERENQSYLFASSLGTLVALTLFTSGVYGWIWLYRLIRSVRMVCEEEGGAVVEFLLCMLVPFYSVYWYCTRGRRLAEAARSYGYAVEDQSIVLAVFALFGFGLINLCLVQDNINRIAWGTCPRLD